MNPCGRLITPLDSCADSRSATDSNKDDCGEQSIANTVAHARVVTDSAGAHFFSHCGLSRSTKNRTRHAAPRAIRQTRANQMPRLARLHRQTPTQLPIVLNKTCFIPEPFLHPMHQLRRKPRNVGLFR